MKKLEVGVVFVSQEFAESSVTRQRTPGPLICTLAHYEVLTSVKAEACAGS